MRLSTLLVVLTLGLGCATVGTVMAPEDFHDQLPLRIAEDIEARLIHIANPVGLEKVYYLGQVDTAEQVVRVGYFLVWPGEFPDFGRVYPVSKRERRRQIRLPLYYTNWLYIPRSGGLQRMMFGRGDVEGIGVTYALSDGELGMPVAVSFEMPGHKSVTVPDSVGTMLLGEVVYRNAPYLQMASWNHMFKPPDEGVARQAFPVQPFPGEQWERFNMDRRRAEIAKRGLAGSGSLP